MPALIRELADSLLSADVPPPVGLVHAVRLAEEVLRQNDCDHNKRIE
jgi:hypothetical protein